MKKDFSINALYMGETNPYEDMKRITITYRMFGYRPSSIAESCVTLSIRPIQGKSLLKLQEKDYLVEKDSPIDIILQNLAILQGYESAEFVMAEEAKQ